jgi:hypothetical protein
MKVKLPHSAWGSILLWLCILFGMYCCSRTCIYIWGAS